MKWLNQIESWEVWLLAGCILFFAVYFGQQIDFENAFKKEAPAPVHMGGEIFPIAYLQHVEVAPIPAFVYESLEKDTRFKRYLTGNHKYVFMFTYPGCPYARAFYRAFQELFEEKEFAQYYRKRVITVGRTTTVSCPGGRDMNCATAWVYRNCFGNLCIFNPVRRKVVIDRSHSARQIEPLLTKYQEW